MPRAFEADRDGFNKIARSPEVRAALRAVAEKAQRIAVALSEDFRETGEYIDGFSTGTTTVNWDHAYPGMRGAAILINKSGHGAAVEWGNARNRPEHQAHHVLTTTLAALDA